MGTFFNSQAYKIPVLVPYSSTGLPRGSIIIVPSTEAAVEKEIETGMIQEEGAMCEMSGFGWSMCTPPIVILLFRAVGM